MAYTAASGIIYCSLDELLSVAPERFDELSGLDGATPIGIWPKSRTIVYGSAKYAPLTIEQFDSIKAMI